MSQVKAQKGGILTQSLAKSGRKASMILHSALRYNIYYKRWEERRAVMTDIRVGSRVRWADAIRDRPDARVSPKEVFVVRRITANERCDLVDHRGGELFNVPLRDLQPFDFEELPYPLPYGWKGFLNGKSLTD
jgi:hypothetical protein